MSRIGVTIGSCSRGNTYEKMGMAKSKLDYATKFVDYANGNYVNEMEQAALLAEARAKMK